MLRAGFVVCQVLLFSLPVVRGFDGKEEDLGMGSYVWGLMCDLKVIGRFHPTLSSGHCCPLACLGISSATNLGL